LHEQDRLTLLEIFTGLLIPKVPGPPAMPFWVVSEWAGPRSAQIDFAVQVRREDTGKVVATYPGSAKIGPANKAQPVIKIDGLIFPAAGEYAVEIVTGGNVLISERLSVLPVI
jgi:hypothetical protein